MKIDVQEALEGHSQQSPQTEKIQALIDRCVENGGGCLYFAAGTYLTGMLKLGSRVQLHLESGARLLGCRDEAAYPILRKKPFNEKPGVIRALLYAANAEDICISGQGTVDGSFDEALDLSTAKTLKFRPELIYFENCQKISIRDVNLRDSGFWCLHLMHCQTVRLEGLTIRTNPKRINTDGIDPDGCRDMIIANCDIETGDDCIVIKSTEGQVCENILIQNCILRTHHGALKIGTEALGPIRNINVSNCLIPAVDERRRSGTGIALFMKDGSAYENISFQNIVMQGMHHLAVLVDNRPRYHKTDKAGSIRNLRFSGLQISGGGRMLFEGREESPIRGLSLSDISWSLDQYGLDHAKPMGSARTDHDPELANPLVQPYHLILSNVSESSISDFRLSEERDGSAPDRGLLYLHNVTNSAVRGITSNLSLGDLESTAEHTCEGNTIELQQQNVSART